MHKKTMKPNSEQQARQNQIQQMFDSIADRYDALNDWLSLGMHRRWKNALIKKANPTAKELWVDLACGTGDIAAKLAPSQCNLVLVDPSLQMLHQAQSRLFTKQVEKKIFFVQAVGERLPLHDQTVDKLCISFGVRNAANLDQMLSEIERVLRPGGEWFCLEFFQPSSFWGKLLVRLFFNKLAFIGGCLASQTAYQYLFTSIKAFYTQSQWQQKLVQLGWQEVGSQTFLQGLVGLFWARRKNL